MSSWWINQSPVKFTETAIKVLQLSVDLADVTTPQSRVLVQRAQLLSALEGMKLSKKTIGLMHANVVSRN